MELKKISKEELKEKLKLHKKWLNGEKEGVKLDLRNTNLIHTDLSNSNLESADLRHVNLTNANLINANLEGASLEYANLINANLINANLENANLKYANLTNSNLENANLRNANLEYADLRYSYLGCTDLSNTDLNNSDLTNSDLRYSNLTNSDLSKTKFYSTNLYKTKGDFVGVENIGSRNDTTHYFYNEDRIICGCFNGTMEEFKNEVKETYEESSKEYKQYIIAIDTLKKLAELEGEK